MTESPLTSRGNRHPSLANYLYREGYKIEYITSNFYHAEKRWFDKNDISIAREKTKYKLIAINKIGYLKNISIRRVISNFIFSLKIYHKLRKDIDENTLLVIPSRPVELIYFCSVLRRKYKNSVLVDIQDIWPDMLVNKGGFETYIFTKYCNFFLKNSLKYIDKYIHVAPSFKDWLKRYSPHSKSKFIPLGFDLERWGKIKQKVNIDKNKIKFIVIAQLTFQFDIIPVLKVLKDDKKYELVLVGEDGNGERFDEVNKYVNKHNIRNFKSLGFLNSKDLKIEIANCDVGIVPMISTSIPNKVFDYIANEKPIYVLGKNDCSDFVYNNKIGWYSEYSAKDIKRFLCTLNHHEIDSKRSNLLHIKNNFSREKLFKEVQNII